MRTKIGSWPLRGLLCAGLGLMATAALLSGGCPNVDLGASSGTGVSDANAPQVDATDHILGDPNAPVTVVEYGDFECPACGAFFDQTLPTIRTEYIDAGKVRWVFRHFPLTSLHPNAQAAAEAAECAAAQGAFWEYHDKLYQNQDALDAASLSKHAADLGLDTVAFDACVAADTGRARIQSDAAGGSALGVSATPTFFIGSKMVRGAASVDQFRALLDEALAAQR